MFELEPPILGRLTPLGLLLVKGHHHCSYNVHDW